MEPGRGSERPTGEGWPRVQAGAHRSKRPPKNTQIREQGNTKRPLKHIKCHRLWYIPTLKIETRASHRSHQTPTHPQRSSQLLSQAFAPLARWGTIPPLSPPESVAPLAQWGFPRVDTTPLHSPLAATVLHGTSSCTASTVPRSVPLRYPGQRQQWGIRGPLFAGLVPTSRSRAEQSSFKKVLVPSTFCSCFPSTNYSLASTPTFADHCWRPFVPASITTTVTFARTRSRPSRNNAYSCVCRRPRGNRLGS